MPRIDFNSVAGVENFAPIPAGDYTCRLTDIEPDVTRAGHEKWRLRWEVQEGEYAGRNIFDTISFTPKAMPRVKLVCEICGVDVTGEVNLEPEMLLGARARVTVFVEEYVDEHDSLKARSRVPFEGYAALGTAGPDGPF